MHTSIHVCVVWMQVHFTFYRIDRNSTKTITRAFAQSHAHCNTHRLNFDEKLEAAMRDNDAVMANIGVWYKADEEDRYRNEVRYMLSRLQTLAPQGKLGLFRQSTPQHFPTATGSGLFEERNDVMPGSCFCPNPLPKTRPPDRAEPFAFHAAAWADEAEAHMGPS
mmetsp:Transcript_19304/g.39456  ORF Transcript_19304/g.39456 Transcript_19304/m.39456 type:complete len:165 (-) Transcript_19304:7-501(-)